MMFTSAAVADDRQSGLSKASAFVPGSLKNEAPRPA